MEETDFAYLAGLIDGDGSFYLQQTPSKPARGRVCKLIIEMNHRPTIIWVSNQFGGNYSWAEPRGNRTKPSYRWEIGPKLLREYLPRLLPYLKTKREVGYLMLEYVTLSGQTRGPLQVSPERHQQIADEVSSLNKKSRGRELIRHAK